MSTEAERHLVDNVSTVLELDERELRAVGRHDLIVRAFARGISRPLTIYLLLLFCAAWMVVSRLASARFDPWPHPALQGIITVYAAVVSTCVLIAQSLERAEADRRAKLELHVNLVAEQKTTKIIALLEELRRDLPNVPDRTDDVAQELQRSIDPGAIHTALSPGRDDSHR